MSIETWKKEFYPVEANQVSKQDAIAHSLKKWTGATKDNIQKHGVERAGYLLFDDRDAFGFGGETCALCVHHAHKHQDSADPCRTCPIVRSGGKACGERGSAYGHFLFFGPRDMIRVLMKALKWQNEQSTTKKGKR
jgi:hypothetical protein